MIPITILSLFAGRHYTLPSYLNCLHLLNYPKESIDLIWITNTTDESFYKKLEAQKDKLKSKYRSIELLWVQNKPPDGYAFTENPGFDNVTGGTSHASIITDLYQLGWERNHNEYVAFIEDDAIYRADILDDFLKTIQTDPKIAYVTCAYRCRHTEKPIPSYLSELHYNGSYKLVQYEDNDFYEGIREVDTGGWVNCLVRKSLVDQLPKPIFKMESVFPQASVLVGPDIIFTAELKLMGFKNICDYKHIVGHLDSKGKIH